MPYVGWFVRLGGELRLRAARREAIDVDRLGCAHDVDLDAAFQRPPSDLPIPDVEGAANPGDRRALSALASYLGTERILEIGTHIGASTASLARVADVVTVDIADVNADQGPWRVFGAEESPGDMLRRLGLFQRVRFVRESSVRFLRSTSEQFDLVFLDGDHSAATVYEELAAASWVLRPGGFIVLHDYFPEGKSMIEGVGPILGPYRAVARIRREASDLAVRPLGHLPWPTKLGSYATTLALVGHK